MTAAGQFLPSLAVFLLAGFGLRHELAAQPNVIIIFTDDQGTVDAACFGSDDLATPAIDRLAATGVRFTQFYAAAPVCSPSRAGLLTGRYNVLAGVPGNVSSERGRAGMPTDQVTIAEVVAGAGYRTAHIGKWHLGYTPETMPNGQGFEHSFGHMGGCIDNYSHFFYWNGPNRHDLYRNGEEIHLAGRFFPDLMAVEAEEFIRAHREHPFFLYFALNSPHYPYQGEAEWLHRYEKQGTPHPRNLYGAFVSTLDARIGRLLDLLEELDLRRRTIVIFQSDHGHSTEERAHFGGGSSGPYRGAKFSLFEGGIRVPAIISWPGSLPEGKVRGGIAHGCDWLPTIATLCGTDVSQLDLDGRDLSAMIRDGAASPHAEAPIHWEVGDQWAVRLGDWKLIGSPRDTGRDPARNDPKPGDLFLANLAEDPGETIDWRSRRPDMVEKLQRLRNDWIRSRGQ